jgi:AcrR family transcriptional regulator
VARLTAEDRRALLVEAALTVMARDGVAAATTRSICAEAAMPQSAFHYAFRSKAELLQRITELSVGTITADLDQRALDGKDLRDTLVAAMDLIHESIVVDAPRQMVVYELTLMDMRAPDDPGSLGRWQYSLYTQRAASLLASVAEHAEVRWTADLHALARLVATAIDGTALAWLADRDSDASRASLHVLADALVALAEPRS